MDPHHHHHHHNPHQQHQYLHHQQQQQQQQQSHHHHHQQFQNQINQNPHQGHVVGVNNSACSSMSVDVTDRFPQWSLQETKELLGIRADLDQTFMETKRNKPLWEVIASRMKEKSYNRSADQCKCKWKNLVTRYKGCETIEAESVRQQFPFYNELQAIFTARMQRMLWAEAEGGGLSKNKKPAAATPGISSEEEDEDNNNNDIEAGFSDGEQKGNIGTTASSGAIIIKNNSSNDNKKLKRMKSGVGIGIGGGGVREVLEEFMRQQAAIEGQWREAWEAREDERRGREDEWRRAMQAIEAERLLMERGWREREEQRRLREEARAEKRDALITALLNKLRREGDHL